MRKKPLQCPFCDNKLAKPVNLDSATLDITCGICQCGAVYVLDGSGHNLGQTFMDALAFACKEDYDKALSLPPEEYETETLMYDLHLNTASICENAIVKSPKLLFLRLKTGS